jgi:hypothetical protein
LARKVMPVLEVKWSGDDAFHLKRHGHEELGHVQQGPVAPFLMQETIQSVTCSNNVLTARFAASTPPYASSVGAFSTTSKRRVPRTT